MSDAQAPRTTANGATATRARIPSQITIEAPRLHGDVALWADRNPEGSIELVYDPGPRVSEAHMRDGMTPWAVPPTITWIADGGRRGPITLPSFVWLWNQEIEEVDGIGITTRIEPSESLALPFPAWHPCGCLQLCRFDVATRRFTRRILYGIIDRSIAEAVDRGQGAAGF